MESLGEQGVQIIKGGGRILMEAYRSFGEIELIDRFLKEFRRKCEICLKIWLGLDWMLICQDEKGNRKWRKKFYQLKRRRLSSLIYYNIKFE